MNIKTHLFRLLCKVHSPAVMYTQYAHPDSIQKGKEQRVLTLGLYVQTY